MAQTILKRLLVFAREDIELSQRNDLMCPEISNVWLQLNSDSQKVLLNFTYREFNDLTGKGRMSISEQTERVNKLVDQIEKACSEGLVVALGDMNLDLNRKEDTNYNLKQVADEYYSGVARCGLDILNFGITWRRVYQTGEIRESSIDHLLVNKPASIIRYFPIEISYSDHKAICADFHVNVQKQEISNIFPGGFKTSKLARNVLKEKP